MRFYILIRGERIGYADKYDDGSGTEKELTVEEWKALVSFRNWVKDVKPKFIATEKTIAAAREMYDKRGWKPWVTYTGGGYKKFID